MSSNLTTRTLNGLNWSYLGTIINAVLQIGFTAVLARLIEPSAYGLVALAGIVLRFVTYFSTMGIGPALIQKGEISDEDIRASFSFSVLLGLFFFGVFWFIAPIAGLILQNPDVVPVVKVMAGSMIIGGFSITSVSLLRRRLEFRSLAIIDTISFFFGHFIVGIVMALMGFGVWSLIVPSLVQAGIITIISFALCRHSIKPLLNWRYYKGLFAFGSQISLLNFFQFIYYSIPTIFIGRLSGVEFLGYYNNASRLANLPFEYLMTAFNRVLFPSFSKLQAEPVRIKKTFLSAQLLISLLFFPATFGMSVAAKEITLLLLGHNWIDSAQLLQILLIATPFTFLNSLSGVIFDATSNLKKKFFIEVPAIIAIGLFASFTASVGKWVVIAYTIVEIGRYIAYLAGVSSYLKITWIDLRQFYSVIFRNTLLVVVVISVFRFAFIWLKMPLLAILVGEILVGLFTFIILTLEKSPDLVKEEIRNIYIKLIDARRSETRITKITDSIVCKYFGLTLERANTTPRVSF